MHKYHTLKLNSYPSNRKIKNICIVRYVRMAKKNPIKEQQLNRQNMTHNSKIVSRETKTQTLI